MFAFDLSQLTEFNPGIVYAFEPESTSEHSEGSEGFEDHLYPSMGQFRDVFLAYQYAERSILPLIRERGIDKITPEQFLSWLKQLHSYLGHTLLEKQDKQAGKFTDEEVLRWSAGVDMHQAVGMYMLKVRGFKTPKEFAKAVKQAFAVPEVDSLAFITILDKIKSLPDSILSPSQMAFITDKVEQRMTLWLKKLVPAYHQNILSAEEKACVDKIVKVCIPVEQIEPAMHVYAQRTLALWRNCDPKDLVKVSEMLSESFYGLTEIHPFGNGNGRTATCLINIMLRSLNLPSILVREPGERDSKDSSYSIAFAQIEQSRKALADHLYRKITTALHKPFCQPQLELVLQKRLELADLLQEMTKKCPKLDPNQEYGRVQKAAFAQLPATTNLSDNNVSASIQVLSAMNLALRQSIDSQLRAKAKANFAFTGPMSDLQKTEICEKLGALTGIEAWKAYNTQGKLTILAELDDKQVAEKCIKTLQEFNLMKLELKIHALTKNPVIKCTEINLNKLMSLALSVKPESADTKVFQS